MTAAVISAHLTFGYLLHVVDLFETFWILKRGGREMNPIMAPLVSRPLLFAAVKLIVAALLMSRCYLIWLSGDSSLTESLWIHHGILGAVVCWNALQIGRYCLRPKVPVVR